MYIDILLRWNARINLTAIRNEEEIVTRHFGESFFAARHLLPKPAFSRKDKTNDSYQGTASSPADSEPQKGTRALAPEGGATRVADLGSGAGFPGIPIKLWAPNIALTLIESNHKKATFLREVARALTLTDIDIQNVRAETLPPSTFDAVTLRAVERFAETLPVAARLLAPGGRLALLIGDSQVDIARSALPTFAWDPPIPQSQSRVLLTGTVEPQI